ncbi:unnamed protein product [Oikopleura dioica]|uniref:Uncharacterized protein n=1 Tax=Oikopleura dioica TaxID=34765 RepID=E4WU03_OIKDI|nr:unnamed protein product [Oikopleura dioica]
MRLIPTFLLAFGLTEALETHNRVARAAHHFGLGGHTNNKPTQPKPPKPSKAPKPPKPSKAPKPPKPSNQGNNNNNMNNNMNNNDGGKIVAPPCPPEWKPRKCGKKQNKWIKREKRRLKREQKLNGGKGR